MTQANYRIVEKEYDDGGTAYQVQRSFPPDGAWAGVFSSKDLDKAKEVLQERRGAQKFIEKVLDL